MPDNMRNESAIKQMRNVVAHRYGAFDFDILWETVTSDIPTLKAFCEEIV